MCYLFNQSILTNAALNTVMGLLCWLNGKESACNVGDLGSIPGSGRSPGEGNGSPLQYSCMENPMDGGAWQATVHEVPKSWARRNDFTFTFSQVLGRVDFSLGDMWAQEV